VILEKLIMISSKITGDISEIAGDPAISEHLCQKDHNTSLTRYNNSPRDKSLLAFGLRVLPQTGESI
jgi:hypothetical protein